MAFRRFFEETAWRIKAVKLERDRHANQRHLNPLNVGDLFTAMVESMKGRNQDAILVLGEVRLHRHFARPSAVASHVGTLAASHLSKVTLHLSIHFSHNLGQSS